MKRNVVLPATPSPPTPTTPGATSYSDLLTPLNVGENLEALSGFLDRRLRGVPTGWPPVDRALLGLGGLVILQGAPGTNKSTAALQIASHNAVVHRRPALVIDEENGRDRTRIRLLCQLTGMCELDLQAARLRERHAPGPHTAWNKALKTFERLPVYVASGVIDGKEESELEKLGDALLEKAHAEGSDRATLVVDSVQALPRIEAEERHNLEAWLKRLDRLKLRYDGKLVILATSEKSYATFDEASLRGGKGSSAISYKGETILDFASDKRRPGVVRVTVVKNRDGFKGASWPLELELSDKGNPASFNYRLAAIPELPE